MTIHGLSEFQDHGRQWNHLWDRSDAYELTSRSEGVVNWIKHFGDSEDFAAVVVADQAGDFVGALAVSSGRSKGLSTLNLPANGWANAGELLIDRSFGRDEICDLLVQQLRKQNADLVQFDFVRFESDRWQAFLRAVKRAGGVTETSRTHECGSIEIGDDWEQYFSCLSRNHRSAVRRGEKKAKKRGETKIERITDPSESELVSLLQSAFEIEHQSWKGENGSSILACKQEDYYITEARNALRWGGLELWFLHLDDEPIAFEYCHVIHGRCLSYKIGYKDTFRDFGPGQVLRKNQLEFHTENQRRTYAEKQSDDQVVLLDTMGILCHAKAKWATKRYHIGCINASLGDFGSNLCMKCFSTLRQFRSVLKRGADPEPLELGGESFRSRVSRHDLVDDHIAPESEPATR